MEKKEWKIIGLMSGTSLDGIDLVFAKFTKENQYTFDILATETIEYSDLWKNRLKDAFGFSGEKLVQLDADYGFFLAKVINDFIDKNKLSNIDFVASHGQTIFHQPQLHYTTQIGNGAIISAETKLPVYCDFRKQDVALGGQGAPLVPIGDQLLFSEYEFCLNLGGFSNISFDKKNERLAFDICPVNIVMNHYAEQLGFPYDDGGKIARQGKLNKILLTTLNELDFYKGEEPKSLGYEFVVEKIFPIIDSFNLSAKDVLRTYVEHIAMQIADVIGKNSHNAETKVLVSGGGALNQFLIEKTQSFTQAELVIPTKQIIDFKEAIIFAFLAVLKSQEEINCLKSVTGAKKDHSSGVYFKV
ncbi:anhydro-N-acetylmuramic acid kinase [Namhaeicola litoreus]|uniref:Anhydro-N-acetylmuramic acid kinase n=1 Tax=Namhaeicola litoreus TaxID=1052145 RepID=A0ABW3Y0R4_9FLAO